MQAFTLQAAPEQVNLDRFNIFLPEKRPFFLENAGQFTVGNSEQVELSSVASSAGIDSLFRRS